jgi:hypothetical protein
MKKERNREVDISRNTMERRESIKRERERSLSQISSHPMLFDAKVGQVQKIPFLANKAQILKPQRVQFVSSSKLKSP